MKINEATRERIRELCAKKGITPNALSYICGVPQATIKSILNSESKSPKVETIKKLCDGLEITIAHFFDTEVFNSLEQEIE